MKYPTEWMNDLSFYDEVRQGPALLQRFNERLEQVGPVVVGAGDVALGGERALVEGVTACLDAAGLGRLDDNPRSVEVTRDHIAFSVHELSRGRGVVSRILPAAGEDDPHGRIGIGLAAAPRTLFC